MKITGVKRAVGDYAIINIGGEVKVEHGYISMETVKETAMRLCAEYNA